MTEPVTLQDAQRSADLVLEDLNQLLSGSWIPDDESINDSIGSIQIIIDYLNQLKEPNDRKTTT